MKLFNPLKETKNIQHVIYNDDDAPTSKANLEKVKADIKKLMNTHSHLDIYSWSEFMKLDEGNKVEPTPPSPKDLACIMYTSGLTEIHKDVLLSHKNVIAAVADIDMIIGPYLGPRDGPLTYLPLACMLRFVFESTCLYWAITMGYWDPKTIFDNSMKKCQGDIAGFKSTILVSLPAVWETVKTAIMVKIGKLRSFFRNLFWGAMTARSFMINNSSYLPLSSVDASVVDKFMFKKIAEPTGNRLRICITGGGPIAEDTQRFISTCIAQIVSGYGLIEILARDELMNPLSWTVAVLGEIPGSVETKLVDFADTAYFSINKPL